MISLRSSLGAMALVCALSNCADGLRSSAVQAPRSIGDSFVVYKKGGDGSNGALIGIKRASLGKEFLLQGEMIRQPVVARFNNLKSRIVMFRQHNQKLSMMEAIDGHSSSSSLDQNFLLTQFSIVKEEKDTIYFDFSEGMSKIFVTGDWYASDSHGTHYKPENAWKTVRLSNNYIDSAEADNDNNLVIRQIAQVAGSTAASTDDEEGSYETAHLPVEVKYYLTPYRKNPGFVPRESPGMKSVGFFEIAPRLENGGEKVYASRWDERKPIVFSISANTPKEYIQAIKDGVLYWNKAFGKEVVKVNMAPEGVVAPDFHYNMIQWVDWTDAGYAYADAQMDPRTGEIMHASIFLTSVFAFNSKIKARQLLRRLTFESEKGKQKNNHLALKGFEQDHLCDYEISPNVASILTQALSEVELGNLDEKTFLKISQDTVTATVAHEAGHVMGLRHEFGGSNGTNIPNDKRAEVFKDYLVNGKASDTLTPTTSIMDYLLFQDDLIAGDQIVHWPKAYDYDTKAIQQLYFDIKPTDMPVFCTDSQVGTYIDCGPFDFGPSMFEFAKLSEENAFETLPYTLMERFIAIKSPSPGSKQKDLTKAVPTASSIIVEAMKPRVKLLKALSEGAQFLNAPLGTTGDDDTDYLKSEIKKGGGLGAFLKGSRFDEIKKASQVFDQLLQNNSYMMGEGAGGHYEFTDDEKAIMKQSADIFFNNLPYLMVPIELAIYKLPVKYRMEAFGNELADIFADRAWKVITLPMGVIQADLEKEDHTKVRIKVPQFFFSDDERLEAAAILNSRSEQPIWGYKAKAKMRKNLRGMIDASFKGLKFDDLEVENLPEDLGAWVLTQRRILDALR